MIFPFNYLLKIEKYIKKNRKSVIIIWIVLLFFTLIDRAWILFFLIGIIGWMLLFPKRSKIEKIEKQIQSHFMKGLKTGFGTIIGIIFGIFILLILFVAIYYSVGEPDILPKSEFQVVKNIAEEYHRTHTYSEIDFFVCADMSIDVWNLIKSKGINAQIYAGNINVDIKNIEFEDWNWFNNINHAWVMAEVNPFEWIAVETTGGYLVWGEKTNESEGIIKNRLYYYGYSFDNPKEFKKFIELRKDVIEICGESSSLIDYWNENYVGKYLTHSISEFKGKVEQKQEECKEIVNKLDGLLS